MDFAKIDSGPWKTLGSWVVKMNFISMGNHSILPPVLEPTHFHREVEHFLRSGQWQSPQPSLAHVAELSQHFAQIPYENLSKIINLNQHPEQPPLRMPDAVWEGFNRQHLGGTCYALTFFLATILQYFGYDAKPMTADMNWGQNVHSGIILTFANGRYLLDPGYLIHHPLPLSRTQPQRLDYPYLSVELRGEPESDAFNVFTYRKGQPTWRYRFDPRPLNWATFAERWHRSFTLPSMDGLLLTRVTPNGMLYIHNDYLRVTETDRIHKARDMNEVEHFIETEFGIPLTLVEEARHALRENQSRLKTVTGAT